MEVPSHTYYIFAVNFSMTKEVQNETRSKGKDFHVSNLFTIYTYVLVGYTFNLFEDIFKIFTKSLAAFFVLQVGSDLYLYTAYEDKFG